MEQATTRFARLDHPIVHAETTGAMNNRAQPARRTSRRKRRLDRRRCERPGVVRRNGAVAVRARASLPCDLTWIAGTSIKTANDRGMARFEPTALVVGSELV
jgi:hypothetical protein